ncbi:signal peptidase I [Candidatus Fermentibacteria bacterium]|nr:signal peptidase I [Candidatus Fermentibacteria bacterium]
MALIGATWGERIRLAVMVIALFAFRSAIADWNDVPTGSMRPTILEGERIFVNKLAYDLKVPFTRQRIACWADPRRGDIVVFYSPADGKRLVKRVIGVPGDTVALEGGRLMVNGTVAHYHRADPQGHYTVDGEVLATECLLDSKHLITVMPDRPAPRWFGPVVVPEGRYLMMGDNRDNSADSRFFGFVERRAIAGKAPAVVVSLDPGRFYLPRFHRFLSRLA